ncbi:MAG: 1-acyl-sn-glycerol-3-phosphate acyltransferase [Chroococcus sp. CMT-3BRIN-NPC107]|jgi:1-acyl-sn-glycerol-3-phosphate acyltransferase|nr:1-acyl-sn-glycerol-3-phosphate acyltransferase [Chroococcus sp. CMT-3BRIN-NPC107]
MNNANSSQQISHGFITATGTKIFRYYEDRTPQNSPVLVVSNHRSFMDAPILMAAIEKPIRFACHHYMGQVPIMREIVTGLGCFPLDAAPSSQKGFFQQALQLLQENQAVGIFPEGTKPMVDFTEPNGINDFQRGFAHLALRADTGSDKVKPVKDLVILPVAIASIEETVNSAVPLRLLSLFDPTEPLFNQNGWHPLVIYRRVAVLIGRPYRITSFMRQQYQGKQAKTVVADVTNYCQAEIVELLRQGCY